MKVLTQEELEVELLRTRELLEGFFEGVKQFSGRFEYVIEEEPTVMGRCYYSVRSKCKFYEVALCVDVHQERVQSLMIKGSPSGPIVVREEALSGFALHAMYEVWPWEQVGAWRRWEYFPQSMLEKYTNQL